MDLHSPLAEKLFNTSAIGGLRRVVYELLKEHEERARMVCRLMHASCSMNWS